MYSEALRPGSTLGFYPERDALPASRLDEAARAALGRLPRRARKHRGAGKFVAEVNRAGTSLSGLRAQQLTERVREVQAELLLHGLRQKTVAQAFAIVREVAQRTLGLRHYDCQLMGGWLILNGMLAEIATGEGKTLTATLPACTAALARIPVHVITANDYLAARDARLMSPLYQVLGLSVGVVTEALQDPRARQAAYACDITYCTNKQITFDYLRDRVTMGRKRGSLQQLVESLRPRGAQTESPSPGLLLRGLCFAIVDEADSVLIDEARTPLILSRQGRRQHEPQVYAEALALSAKLDSARNEYVVHGHERQVELTERGKARLAELVPLNDNFWTRVRRRELMIQQALCASHCYLRDRHYLVRDGRVQIIDENTGRRMPDRSWESGLHQMVEAKERCEITADRESLARITYQSFFRRYLRLGAMTGTAREVAGELWSVYGLRVVQVPSHQPVRRAISPARVHATAQARWLDVVTRVRRLHDCQRPVLIGTRSVAASEHLSALLTEAGLAHQVLNAHQDQREAEIVAGAGEAGRITVATNMAGRGTDIRLSPGVAQIGGLHVIATEFNDARRIDRQLFGRCARQGEPGTGEVTCSLEDEILQTCGPHHITRVLRYLQSTCGPLARWPALFWLRLAQRRMEWRHARVRRALMRQERRVADALAFTGPME